MKSGPAFFKVCKSGKSVVLTESVLRVLDFGVFGG